MLLMPLLPLLKVSSRDTRRAVIVKRLVSMASKAALRGFRESPISEARIGEGGKG